MIQKQDHIEPKLQGHRLGAWAKKNPVLSKIKDSQLIDAVVEQVSIDLSKLVSSSNQIKNKVRILSEKMEIDKKTLARLIEKKSKPNYITLFKIYRFLLNETDDSKVLEKAPEAIKKYLLLAHPQTFEKKVSYTAQIDNELKENPVFCELYVLCSTGPLSYKEIANRYGQYGVQLSQRLLKMGVLAQARGGDLVLGPQQTTLSPETILQMGLRLTQTYAKPKMAYELDHNIIGFYAEGLSEEAYKQWLKIDTEAMKRKIEIAEKSSSKGSIRCFTFLTTDTFEMKERNS